MCFYFSLSENYVWYLWCQTMQKEKRFSLSLLLFLLCRSSSHSNDTISYYFALIFNIKEQRREQTEQWRKKKFTSFVALCCTTCNDRVRDGICLMLCINCRSHTGRFVSVTFYSVTLLFCAHIFYFVFFVFFFDERFCLRFLLVLIETPWWSFNTVNNFVVHLNHIRPIQSYSLLLYCCRTHNIPVQCKCNESQQVFYVLNNVPAIAREEDEWEKNYFQPFVFVFIYFVFLAQNAHFVQRCFSFVSLWLLLLLLFLLLFSTLVVLIQCDTLWNTAVHRIRFVNMYESLWFEKKVKIKIIDCINQIY